MHAELCRVQALFFLPPSLCAPFLPPSPPSLPPSLFSLSSSSLFSQSLLWVENRRLILCSDDVPLVMANPSRYKASPKYYLFEDVFAVVQVYMQVLDSLEWFSTWICYSRAPCSENHSWYAYLHFGVDIKFKVPHKTVITYIKCWVAPTTQVCQQFILLVHNMEWTTSHRECWTIHKYVTDSFCQCWHKCSTNANTCVLCMRRWHMYLLFFGRALSRLFAILFNIGVAVYLLG